MFVVPPLPEHPGISKAVLAVLQRDPRWLRASTVIRRILKRQPVSLERLLSGQRSLADATEEERQAWSVYVETIVPLVRLGFIEGQGNFGRRIAADPGEDRPMDHPFVRVRGTGGTDR